MAGQWSLDDVPPLDGKVAVVTGANAGLGEQVATALAGRGATVVLACRNPERAAAARRRIEGAGAPGGLEVVPLDLASLASVRRAADDIAGRHRRLDLLVNNAGVMAVDESRTEDGFETQIGVNHLGHVALTAGLLPVLSSTDGSRVVNVSSVGHRAGRLVLDDLMFERRGYSRWAAYFQSKLANLLFTAGLHRRLTEAGMPTAALAAHPGTAHTDLGTEGSGVLNRAAPFVAPLAPSARAGALPILRAATDPGALSGQFYGPRFVLLGPPTLETPSARARDADDADALWRRSEELTGATFTFR